jgi:shikimate kinase
VDFDAVIERETGQTVAALFAERGEPQFRALEAALSERLAGAAEPCVLAPGGGWASNGPAVAALRSTSWVVWLRVGVGEAMRRIRDQGGGRPLLAGADAEGALAALLARRQEQYERADAQVETDGLVVSEVVRRVVLAEQSLLGELANRPVNAQ